MGKIGVRGLGPARASARSTGRIMAALVIALCTLMVGAHVAFADVEWEHKGDSSGYQAKVAPYDYTNDGRAGATAEFLGFNWASMSSDVKSKILNDSNGNNAFRNLMDNHCWNVVYDLETGANPIADTVGDLWAVVFGHDKVWRLACSTALYGDAQDVVNKWLYPNDGTGDGSSGGGTGGDGTGSSASTGAIPSTVELNYTGNGTKINNLDTIYLNFNETYHTKINNQYNTINANNNYGWVISKTSSNSVVYYVPLTCAFVYEDGHLSYMVNNSNTTIDFYSATVNNTQFGSNDYADVNGVLSTTRRQLDAGSHLAFLGSYYISNIDGDVSEPYVPTPDPTPTAPTIQIGDVTIDLSNGPVTYNNGTYSVVYAPDNSWSVSVENHTDNQYGGDVTATDPTDYTSILNTILAAINAFRQEVNGFNNQINANITTAINSINTSLHSIDTSLGNKILNVKDQLHTDIQTLQSNIQDTIKKRWDAFSDDLWNNMAALDSDIIDELDAVARYIVDGINFDGGLDDDEIVKWLKKIYLKNRGKVTTPAPDDDPKGWLDRLTEILNALLDAMLSGLNVAQLATLFDGLKSRFPISIPWDIAAIVNMFAGGAVTPVFDLPLPNGTNGSYTTIHVDLHEWDDEMALVRQGELVLFGMVLMYNTKWMFDTVTMTFRRGE